MKKASEYDSFSKYLSVKSVILFISAFHVLLVFFLHTRIRSQSFPCVILLCVYVSRKIGWTLILNLYLSFSRFFYRVTFMLNLLAYFLIVACSSLCELRFIWDVFVVFMFSRKEYHVRLVMSAIVVQVESSNICQVFDILC